MRDPLHIMDTRYTLPSSPNQVSSLDQHPNTKNENLTWAVEKSKHHKEHFIPAEKAVCTKTNFPPKMLNAFLPWPFQ